MSCVQGTSRIANDIGVANSGLEEYQVQFSNNRTLTITYTSVAETSLATTNGFYCYGIHMPSHRLKMERFYKVIQCIRYYKYSHSTSVNSPSESAAFALRTTTILYTRQKHHAACSATAIILQSPIDVPTEKKLSRTRNKPNLPLQQALAQVYIKDVPSAPANQSVTTSTINV